MGRVRVKVTVKAVDRGLERLKKLERKLRDGRTYVKVGVIGDRKGAGTPGASGIDMVGLAIVHEFGSPKRSIPERSWIRSTFDQHLPRYQVMLRHYVRKMYENAITPERALGIMGVLIATDIKKRVTSGPPIPPPNAPSTLRRKMKLGRKSLARNTRQLAKQDGANLGRGAVQGPINVRTLIDTGRMVGSVSWVVVSDGTEEKSG